MFPTFAFPTFDPSQRADISQEQLFLALLNIKTQQTRLQSLLFQQPFKYNLQAQNAILQNPFQLSASTNLAQQAIRPELLTANMERINPYRGQIQPSQLDFQLMRSITSNPLNYMTQVPAAEQQVKQEEKTQVTFGSNSDSEVSKDNSELGFQKRAIEPETVVKREENEIVDDDEEEYQVEEESSQEKIVSEKVSLSKKIKKANEKAVNTCGHPERKHYAKGLCNNCYHKFGRVGKPELCEHDIIYAKGLCQKCYLLNYNQQKAQSLKKKKKGKKGYRGRKL
mmetsp:Transcript_21120/g.24495  ORF Transcript_21120/g.24495 Transcript_21120/m.24495 type:complete len:282 (+) Transcript_21120:58-903(+)